MGGSESDSDEPCGLGAHYRSSMGGMADGSDSKSEDGGISRPDGEGDDEGSVDDGMACRLSDLESEPEDLAAVQHRCASPEPLPVLGPPDAHEEDFEEASPDALAAGSANPVGAEESGEEEELAVDPVLSDSSSEGFVERDAVPGCASSAALPVSSASVLAPAVGLPGVAPRMDGLSAVPLRLPRRVRFGATFDASPGDGCLEVGDVGGSCLGLSVGSGSGSALGDVPDLDRAWDRVPLLAPSSLAAGERAASRQSRPLAGDLAASGLASSAPPPPEAPGSSALSGSKPAKRLRVS